MRTRAKSNRGTIFKKEIISLRDVRPPPATSQHNLVPHEKNQNETSQGPQQNTIKLKRTMPQEDDQKASQKVFHISRQYKDTLPIAPAACDSNLPVPETPPNMFMAHSPSSFHTAYTAAVMNSSPWAFQHPALMIPYAQPYPRMMYYGATATQCFGMYGVPTGAPVNTSQAPAGPYQPPKSQ